MKIILKQGGYKRLEHGWDYNAKPIRIGINECWESEKEEDTGCAGCRKDKLIKSKHIITIPFRQKVNECYKNKIPCYNGDYYKTYNSDDYVDLSGCEDC